MAVAVPRYGLQEWSTQELVHPIQLLTLACGSAISSPHHLIKSASFNPGSWLYLQTIAAGGDRYVESDGSLKGAIQ